MSDSFFTFHKVLISFKLNNFPEDIKSLATLTSDRNLRLKNQLEKCHLYYI